MLLARRPGNLSGRAKLKRCFEDGRKSVGSARMSLGKNILHESCAMTSRKIVLFAFAFLLGLAGVEAGWAASPQTKVPYALLIDDNTGAVLFAKNANAPMAPASTTKILTAEIVFREIVEGRLRLDDTAPISPRAAREGDAESGGSRNIRKPVPALRRRGLKASLLSKPVGTGRVTACFHPRATFTTH